MYNFWTEAYAQIDFYQQSRIMEQKKHESDLGPGAEDRLMVWDRGSTPTRECS
jgi:hypothetical protein